MLKKLGWILTASLLVAFFVLPLLAIAYLSIDADWSNLQHLWQTVLVDYISNSTLLVLGTVGLSLCFALPSAWIVSNYQFFGHKILQWVLCLPLAIPAYLVGYLYTDLLDYPGAVQSFLRQLFGWISAQDYWFPAIRTLGGASVVLALVLYPYIFLLARIALLEQSENLLHSAKTLGASRFYLFRKITFPLIRPAIVVGAALVAMETLGDFGTVYYFAVPTLTTAIYDTWLGYGDIGSASQISLLMLLMILSLLWVEQYSRRKQKIYQRGYEKKPQLKTLHGWKLWLALFYCWGLVSAAFFIPLGRLIYWSISYFELAQVDNFLKYAGHSFSSSSLAALTCVLFALFLHFFKRFCALGYRHSQLGQYSLMISSLGYAIPGTILAIGIMIPYISADHLLNDMLDYFGISPVGLVFSGSIFALVSAYTIRFSAMAIGSIETSFQKISPSLDMAARTLGQTEWGIIRKVHIPLLSKGILTALMLVFIETMKELNASLLLRPFNFDTLATHVFNFTSDEQLEQAALPAIALVLVGLLPVLWLTRSLILNSEKDR
ncbi:ABC transporter permease subunit [[Haemophilus] felis]|nr:ABC transporter permease subunit [[Haemophilus] felis]